MEIERGSRLPAYRQIVEHFRSRILSGDLPPGVRLPPERALAAAAHVNRSTVQMAYLELKAMGLVEARVGGGTFVAAVHERPRWTAYLSEGQFFPDSSLRSEVLEGIRRHDVLRLATVTPPGDLAPELATILRRFPEDLRVDPRDRYGYEALREEIAAYMGRLGMPTRAESVLILSGPQEGLHLASQCLLRPGDNVATERPSALFSLDVFPSAGVRLFGVPVDPDGMEPRALTDLLGRRPCKVVVVNPTAQNPTGATLSLARRQELLATAGRWQVPILEDDRYGGLWFGPEPEPPRLRALDRQGGVLYMGGFGESLGPLLRIAWVTGPQPVVDRLANAKWQLEGGMSLLSQWALAEWLREGRHEPHLAELSSELRRRCAALEEALRAAFGGSAAWWQPAGGYHLWVRFDTEVSSVTLFRRALRRGVATMPGSLFGREVPGAAHLRLSFAALPADRMAEAVRRLKDAYEAREA